MVIGSNFVSSLVSLLAVEYTLLVLGERIIVSFDLCQCILSALNLLDATWKRCAVFMFVIAVFWTVCSSACNLRKLEASAANSCQTELAVTFITSALSERLVERNPEHNYAISGSYNRWVWNVTSSCIRSVTDCRKFKGGMWGWPPSFH